jgi:hypothetical protein
VLAVLPRTGGSWLVPTLSGSDPTGPVGGIWLGPILSGSVKNDVLGATTEGLWEASPDVPKVTGAVPTPAAPTPVAPGTPVVACAKAVPIEP